MLEKKLHKKVPKFRKFADAAAHKRPNEIVGTVASYLVTNTAVTANLTRFLTIVLRYLHEQ